MGDFHKYYSGQTRAPVLTIVIGGNHEASNYMFELFHGGWIAPQIYYLGKAGSVIVNGLRISGASGIFNDRHYTTGFFETIPYDHNTIRSTYHTRQFDMARLSQLAREKVDVFLSHDWPATIEQHGNTRTLIKYKPHFQADIKAGKLGSPPLYRLLQTLKPYLWFSAHLHVKFSAVVKHDGSKTAIKYNQPARAPRPQQQPFKQASVRQVAESNPDEISLDLSDEDTSAKPTATQVEAALEPDAVVDESVDLAAAKKAALVSLLGDNPNEIALDVEEATPELAAVAESVQQAESFTVPVVAKDEACTRFLALSKCVHRGQFLQLLEIDASSSEQPVQIQFDPLWLAITRAFHTFMTRAYRASPIPQNSPEIQASVSRELEWVQQNLQSGGHIPIHDIQTFVPSAPIHMDSQTATLEEYSNPQTEAFLKWLQLPNKIYTPKGGQ